MTEHDGETENLSAEPAEIAGALVIDVRRPAAFEQAQYILPGAMRGDPERLDDWSRVLDPRRDIVVYCVHGHEVSRNAARQLCAKGLRARFLRGGITAWEAAGLPLAGKS